MTDGFPARYDNESGTERAEKTIARADEQEEKETKGEGLPATAADVCETSACTAPQSQSNRIHEDCGPPAKKQNEIMTIKIKNFHHLFTMV